MIETRQGVVDAHYHILSHELLKAIAECAPSGCRYDLREKVFKSRMGGGMEILSEEEQIFRAKEEGVDLLWVSTRTTTYYDRGALPYTSSQYLPLSQTINDYFASLCRRYPQHFLAYAEIPLALGDVAIQEMDRALNKLGLHGITLESNYDGKYLDFLEFRPFLEEANRQKVIVLLHPVTPAGLSTAVFDYSLNITVAFPFDTTLALARLAYSGVLEQFPDITFIVSHAGGTLPFLWWRIDHAYRENWSGGRSRISKPPTEYLRNCYYDTALSDMGAWALTCERVGVEHVIMGTDRPYRLNALKETLDSIKRMNIPEGDKKKIMGKNSLHILGQRKA